MLKKSDLRKRAQKASEKKEKVVAERQRQEEEKLQRLTVDLLEKYHQEMKKAADDGLFWVEIEVPNDKELQRRLCSKLSDFSPQIFGDGYMKEHILLRW